MQLLRPFFALGSVFALLAACGGSDGDDAPKAGLALTITTDGTVAPDRLNLRVTSGDTVFLGTDVTIGAASALPRTVNVDASGTATVVVKAWQGSTPLDRRDIVVGPLPASGYAPVTITLGAKCTVHVRSEGGDIVSDCGAGTTCNPADGNCGASQVAPSACTPGAVTCADGQSTQRCKADGSGYEAAVSCNGKTCAGDACTTCNLGDESCGAVPTTCTPGAFRCGAGKTVERCQADRTFKFLQECDYVCAEGACKGECGPGSTRCVVTFSDGTVKAGANADETYQGCVSGPDCKATSVVVQTCGSNAEWQDPGMSCPDNCTPGGEFTTYACGFCGGKARCLAAAESCTCNE